VNKSDRLFYLCQTRSDLFLKWEQNQGPRQHRNENPRPKKPPATGPGTELAKLLKMPLRVLGSLWRVNVGSGCLTCYDYAAEMNRWGVAGCRERLEEIVDRLQEEAKLLGLPFTRRGASFLVRLAIRRAEKQERLAADDVVEEVADPT